MYAASSVNDINGYSMISKILPAESINNAYERKIIAVWYFNINDEISLP